MTVRKRDGFEIIGSSVVFTCAACNAVEAVRNASRINPDGIIQIVQAKGWAASLNRSADCLCPRCQRAPRAKHDPDSELKRVAARLQSSPAEAPQPEKEPTKLTPPNIPVTTDQRVKIRNLLDKHFDDGVGRYLDGQSDQKIADAVGVPRLAVEQIREVGYGPIKEDPVLISLRDDLGKAEGEIAKLHAVIVELKQRVEAFGKTKK